MRPIVVVTPAVQAASDAAPNPVLQIEAVYAVFTSLEATLTALRVASELADRLRVPLTLIHFRAVSYPLETMRPAEPSPVETEDFANRLRSESLEIGIRVYVCRDLRQALPLAIRRHSLIVIGGRRRFWATGSERLRRLLERAGHFVLFVDEDLHAA